MELSIFIAQVFALVYLAIGLGMLIDTKYYRKAFDSMIANSGVMYIGGVMALVIGFLIISSHNIWVKDWTVIITVLGWLAVVKGVMLLVFPKAMLNFSKGLMKKNLTIISVIVLILGGVLGYFGFIA